jgi:hypothetical protein
VIQAEIISEIPNLSHEARREITRHIIEAEENSATLAECNRLALERFQMLDAMEAEDEKNAPRRNLEGGFWSGCQSPACADSQRLSRRQRTGVAGRHPAYDSRAG